jgi:hypothetical protein
MASLQGGDEQNLAVICPKCKSEHPPRVIKCGCGHQFRAVQEQPGWTLDYEAPIPDTGFFSFHTFITPALVKIVYVLGVFGIAIASIAIAFIPSAQLLPDLSLSAHLKSTVVASIVFIGGNLLWRVLCELLMVFFSIHATLVAIRRRTKRRVS